MNRRLSSDESGATVVEFAIILVPLLMVVLGFMELGYRSYVRSVLQGSLNDIARAASVENPKLGDDNIALDVKVQNRLKQRMSKLVKSGAYKFEINSYKNFSGVGQPESLITDVNKNGKYDAGDCWEDSNPNKSFDLDAGQDGLGGADDVVVYEVALTAPTLLPVAGLFKTLATFDVKAKTMSRRQPYAEQRQAQVTC
jgi:Flp pilus assembly pilin Flp